MKYKIAIGILVLMLLATVGIAVANTSPIISMVWNGEIFVWWYDPIHGVCSEEPPAYLQIISMQDGSAEYVEVPFWYCTNGDTYAYWNKYWSPAPGHQWYLNVAWIDFEVEPGIGVGITIPHSLRLSPWGVIYIPVVITQ